MHLNIVNSWALTYRDRVWPDYGSQPQTEAIHTHGSIHFCHTLYRQVLSIKIEYYDMEWLCTWNLFINPYHTTSRMTIPTILIRSWYRFASREERTTVICYRNVPPHHPNILNHRTLLYSTILQHSTTLLYSTTLPIDRHRLSRIPHV